MTSVPHRLAWSVTFLRRGASILSLVLLSGLAVLPARAQTLTPAAKKQMADVAAFKASLTPAEKKMSTTLVLASRAAQHKPLGALARFVPSTGTTLDVQVSGHMSPSLLTSSAMRGMDKVDGQIPASVYTTGRARAHVTASELAELASHPDVRVLRETTGAHTNIGSVTSQGYITHRANQVVASGVNGSGIKVGVLSDSASATRVAALIASGDLPSNTVVLPGQAGAGEDEGAAMMEIVHDLAPGAQLFFATAFNGEQSFADNIRALRFQYHCDIIVDDVSYFDEPVFQDGLIADAVNDITTDGGLYFSAAANSGNVAFGTSGTWEGDFRNYGSALPGVGTLHNFGTTSQSQPFDVLTSPAYSGVWLQWSDALGRAADDYDLYIFDSSFTVLKGFSTMTQDGTQDPLEYVYPDSSCGSAHPTGFCPAADDLIVVALYNGSRRALHIDTERANLSIGTDGATFGHNAAKSTVTLAATYWNSARIGIRPFDGTHNPIEEFSSDGPRKIFFQPDGTPITPGRYLFSNNGGTTLQKPDNTAADGISTRTPGFTPFFGTSAAAPHAAAIAALVKSANPRLTNTQIRTILRNTALDNMAPGFDPEGGFGVLNAQAAVAAAQAAAAKPAAAQTK